MNLNNEIVIQSEKDGFNYIQFKVLLDLGINHAYTLKPHFFNTRPGVVSEETFRKSIENYKKFCRTIQIDSNKLVKPNQTHTNIVKPVKKITGSISIEENEYKDTDGLITNIPEVSLATVNADCILLLIYDPVKKVIANIHSGWRGTFNKIAQNAINTMELEYNSNPSDIIVCICPSIRKCHFQVEQDVKNICEEKFAYTNKLNEFIEYKGKNAEGTEKWTIDTVKITKYLLQQCGINEKNIYDCNICSVCNSQLINSCRGDGKNFGLSTAIIKL